MGRQQDQPLAMQNKLVVVTGGTFGIGQVAAETIASQGARIVFIARDPARAADTMAKLQAAGPHAGFRRSAIGEVLFRRSRLRNIEAVQRPVHPRIGAAFGGNRRYSQLPQSRVCRQPLRQSIRRADPSRGALGQAVCDDADAGCRHHYLSRHLAAGRRHGERWYRRYSPEIPRLMIYLGILVSLGSQLYAPSITFRFRKMLNGLTRISGIGTLN
jgi:hypothetical protein